jgi:hypothetical protein
MKTALALTVATSAFLAAASPSLAADKVIKKFDEATIDAVLAAVGATNIEKGKENGNLSVLFTVSNLKYTAYLRRCGPETGCLGLQLQCSFDGATFTTSAANSFNFKYTFTTTAVSEDRKVIYLARHQIANGGTTVANVTENFKEFFSMPALLIEHIKAQGDAPVASAAPQTVPVATTRPSAPDILAGATPAAPIEAAGSASDGMEPAFEKAANHLAL